MNTYKEAKGINELVSKATKILIIQADNPDGDSLGSSLALEQILGDLGKDPVMYCGVEIPKYLHHMPGWDRVQKDIPNQFDLSIIVDTSAINLLESMDRKNQRSWISAKPCIVLDHHDVKASIPFATIVCYQPVVATGEIIYELCHQNGWNISLSALNALATSVLSDSLGLMSEATSARTVHIVAEMIEKGVDLAKLDNDRRTTMRKSPELIKYKARLLERIEYFYNDRIAVVTIPWTEIAQYSQSYNPSMLVLDEMRMTENTDIAIAFKLYNDGKITAKIRCNYGIGIANKLAEHFGGGGHKYASGFKIVDGRSLETIKSECIELSTELLKSITEKNPDETL